MQIAWASHIVGGDIYYNYLGGNNYRFFITLYRDCLSSGAAYDNPISLGVFTTSNGAFVQEVFATFPGSTVLPLNFNNPCIIPPNNICVERAIYTVDINLPPTPGGYTISYQRCCRGPNVTNLLNPDDTGITLAALVPGNNNNNYQNSSPRFTNYPPLLLCNNDDLVFDHSATDPDGDQLVYSLITPYAGGTSLNPMPQPPPSPPYSNVVWAGGYSAPSPLGPGSTISIDANTGILTASPNLLGLYVVAVRVQEYRNGVLIGQTVRDFLFKVFNCNITMQAILPVQEDLATFTSYCQGLTVQFENNSYGGTNYAWDFGVPGVTTDVSNQFAPTFTYPVSGIYTAMLVVNPGWPCTDTAYITVNVNNEFNVSYQSNDSLCILNNSFNFAAVHDGPASSTFTWDFGPNANPNTATGINVNGVNFNVTGNISVTLTGINGACTTSYTAPIYIYPEPIAGIVLPTNYQCNGLTLNFGNNSQNALNNHWDFGVIGTNTDTSNVSAPSFTFPSGGTYDIQLIAGSNAICFDTVTEQITVYEPLDLSFVHDDSLCVKDNLVNFDATVSGPPIAQYSWNFGPNASPSSATTIDVDSVHFLAPGLYNVSLTGSFLNCVETVTSTVFLFREPEINFSVEPGPFCAPSEVSFYDNSLSDVPLQYAWVFGDGSTSSIQNPTHVYDTPGSYSVSLGVISAEGCIDTLFLMQQDAVVIHPSPTSNFTVNPERTDVCHSLVTFLDASLDAVQIDYFFDDSSNYIIDADPVQNYDYLTSGTHWPKQIVYNEYGCSDTSFRKIEIEPFSIYIPNTFTPDGDEHNNDFEAKYGLDVLDWDLRIYNRWGMLISQSTNPEEAWDGSYMSKFGLVQEGTYVYVLRFVSCEFPDAWQMITGHVNVLK